MQTTRPKSQKRTKPLLDKQQVNNQSGPICKFNRTTPQKNAIDSRERIQNVSNLVLQDSTVHWKFIADSDIYNEYEPLQSQKWNKANNRVYNGPDKSGLLTLLFKKEDPNKVLISTVWPRPYSAPELDKYPKLNLPWDIRTKQKAYNWAELHNFYFLILFRDWCGWPRWYLFGKYINVPLNLWYEMSRQGKRIDAVYIDITQFDSCFKRVGNYSPIVNEISNAIDKQGG